MPARPLSDETLHLIDAMRTALSQCSDVEEHPLFGTHAFFVDGKMCIAVKGEELLVRLPPERHGEVQEMQNTRELSPGGGMKGYFWVEPNGYSTRAQWSFWVGEALAYNPLAKASPRKKRAPVAAAGKAATTAGKKPAAKSSAKSAGANKPPTKTAATRTAAAKKHSIFEADD
ncbi:TfoX/Sxy family protein [Acidovorax sp. Leaf78]|uniref:TfoX/Sxy family protein n=1 Tax=unclassified Acidovorax TaxID=2684926 RepID=UPI0006F37F18|nr:TfoX/Sxy family protein [Acidovorax sp. Leaf78]KQO23400.1 transcriptional regulator [Acidovorax sp. Leaf78]